eukprot:sb/3473830/
MGCLNIRLCDREELLTKQELLHYVFIMRCFPATNGFKIYALKNGFLGLGLKTVRIGRGVKGVREKSERSSKFKKLQSVKLNIASPAIKAVDCVERVRNAGKSGTRKAGGADGGKYGDQSGEYPQGWANSSEWAATRTATDNSCGR